VPLDKSPIAESPVYAKGGGVKTPD